MGLWTGVKWNNKCHYNEYWNIPYLWVINEMMNIICENSHVHIIFISTHLFTLASYATPLHTDINKVSKTRTELLMHSYSDQKLGGIMLTLMNNITWKLMHSTKDNSVQTISTIEYTII